jgi:hypothetical protein
MKTAILFFALASFACAQTPIIVTPNPPRPYSESPILKMDKLTVAVTPMSYLILDPSNGAATHMIIAIPSGGQIDINFTTGKVTLPKDMPTDRASREFWFALANSFQEVRAEWLATQQAKP